MKISEKAKKLLEWSAIGGIIFYLVFKVLAIFLLVLKFDFISFFLASLVAGLFTGYELRDYKVSNLELAVSSVFAVMFFLFVKLIFSAFSKYFLALVNFWLLYTLISIPLFFFLNKHPPVLFRRNNSIQIN